MIEEELLHGVVLSLPRRLRNNRRPTVHWSIGSISTKLVYRCSSKVVQGSSWRRGPTDQILGIYCQHCLNSAFGSYI